MTRLMEQLINGYLLPGLRANKHGDRSKGIGKIFGRFKTALGYDDKHVFHSLRHGVTIMFAAAEVPEIVQAKILGHRIQSITTGHYGHQGKGVRFETLQQAIETIRYPGM